MAFTVMNVDQVPEAQRSYGYTGNKGTIQTPHISQLAAEGMVFQTWYSGFHVCSPSRAVMRWATAIWAPAESFPGPRKNELRLFPLKCGVCEQKLLYL